MASIFTRILHKELPGHFVAEDGEFFAILDIHPLTMGHVLVIPKQEVDYIFDLESEVLGRYFTFIKRVAKAIEKVIPCQRIGVAVIGLEVPHAHVHLVPINEVGDINFNKPKLNPTPAQLKEVRDQVEAAFNAGAPDSV